MMKRNEAIELARKYGIPLDADFFTLPASTVARILSAADERKYRKPRNANGSRARYFHAHMVRVASITTKAAPRYVVVFMGNTATYCVHAEACNAATDNTELNRHRCPQTFASVDQAHEWADRDEWEKGDRDKPVKGSARFRVCKCAK